MILLISTPSTVTPMNPRAPAKAQWHCWRERHRPPIRARRFPRAQDQRPVNGAYGDAVTSPDVRKRNFAAFVRRAIRHAQQDRGWAVPRIAKEAGIGSTTIYRWRDGDWEKSPKADQVERFCDALGIPTEVALSILWPGKTGRVRAPEPIPPDPDFEMLLRRLRDPNVSETEKYLIRETVRALAARPAPKGSA
jgi:transcriptional regulator with XRE-family HTH domain